MDPIRADKEHTVANRKKRRRDVWFSIFMTLFLACIVFAASAERFFFYGMPQLPKDLNTLWSMGHEPSWVLLDKDGNVFARRGPHYGKRVPASELPRPLVEAFVAMEDRRFFDHGGVDTEGVLRAAWANFRAGRTVQGGSTITQQVIRFLFLSPKRTIKRKLQEMRLARELEARLSKEQILSLYLNRIYLGNRAYGVTAAAERYFGKDVQDLSISECAMLASLAKAPGKVAPHLQPEAVQKRAKLVLDAMLEAGFLSQKQYETALANPAQAIPPDDLPDHGYIFDLAMERAKSLTGGRTPDLVIQTTIDPKLQTEAETALRTVMDKMGKSKRASQAALVSTDLHGAVRAMVGGRDYTRSKFNRAVAALRQPGSSFKVFVYAAALESGIQPGSIRRDEPVEIAGWSPGNYGGQYRGRVSIREALRRSINTVAAQVTEEIGPGRVANMAKRLGMSTPMQPLPSIALGAQEVTLWDMVQAYSVFANEGMFQDNYLITKITSSSGEKLYERPAIAPHRVYSKKLAREMTGMLREVVLAGTGRRAQLPDRPSAGKTGTSQEWRDAWFIGFTGQYATGVWVGNDDNTPMKKVTGGNMPAQIWHDYMLVASKGLPEIPLQAAEPVLLSESDEGIAAYYAELSSVFGQLQVVEAMP